MSDINKQRLMVADDLFSTAVLRIRQPIEAIFNWLIEKVYILRFYNVRSTEGLMIHEFGRLSATFITLKFNS